MGVNHEVNSPHNFLDDNGEVETSFQIDPKHFQKVAMEFKKKKIIYVFNGIFFLILFY